MDVAGSFSCGAFDGVGCFAWIVKSLFVLFTEPGVKTSVLHPLSGRDWAQGKADVTKVGYGYSHGSQPFCTVGSFIRIVDKVREQWFQFLLEIPFLVGQSL